MIRSTGYTLLTTSTYLIVVGSMCCRITEWVPSGFLVALANYLRTFIFPEMSTERFPISSPASTFASNSGS